MKGLDQIFIRNTTSIAKTFSILFVMCFEKIQSIFSFPNVLQLIIIYTISMIY